MVKTLTRHLSTVHRAEDRVKAALQLPQKARNAAFNQLKKDGINSYNVTEAGLQQPVLQCERSCTGRGVADLTVCPNCSGFFSRKCYYKHKRNCQVDRSKPVRQSIPAVMYLTPPDVAEDFRNEILSRFLKDEVGQLCCTEPSLLSFGQKLYHKLKAKQDKKTEVKRSVMNDMRRLASLFIRFKEEVKRVTPDASVEVKDMLCRDNFCSLETAVIHVTTTRDGTEIKSGLKIGLYYLLKKLAKVIKINYLVKKQDGLAEEIDKFTDVLSMNYNFLFGDAIYQINKSRETKLRRPTEMPSGADVAKVREHTVSSMREMLSDPYLHWTSHEYVKLRDLVDSRITLFNARRGGEPARLTTRNWADAKSGVWLNQDRIENMKEPDRSAFKDMKVMYQTGKGNHLVPFLVPADTMSALDKLSDQNVRADCGVLSSNHYLFPSTNNSAEHVYGWLAVNKVAQAAGIARPDLVTATRVRHLVSTLYAALDVPPNQRSNLYKHMGHSSLINESIYQAPLAGMEISQVGRALRAIEGSETDRQNLQSTTASSTTTQYVS